MHFSEQAIFDASAAQNRRILLGPEGVLSIKMVLGALEQGKRLRRQNIAFYGRFAFLDQK